MFQVFCNFYCDADGCRRIRPRSRGRGMAGSKKPPDAGSHTCDAVDNVEIFGFSSCGASGSGVRSFWPELMVRGRAASWAGIIKPQALPGDADRQGMAGSPASGRGTAVAGRRMAGGLAGLSDGRVLRTVLFLPCGGGIFGYGPIFRAGGGAAIFGEITDVGFAGGINVRHAERQAPLPSNRSVMRCSVAPSELSGWQHLSSSSHRTVVTDCA